MAPPSSAGCPIAAGVVSAALAAPVAGPGSALPAELTTGIAVAAAASISSPASASADALPGQLHNC